jgi:excinuclease ABC subunit C
MKNNNDKVIYIGKAKNLKKRVSSYFNRADSAPIKTQVMMKQVDNIDVTITETESEALILENNLIKEYKPKYNIIFRDDKSYPYIYLTTTHKFPRFNYYRGSLKGKGKYFGPFPSAGSVKKTLNLIQKLFLIRSCEDNVFANRSRPCLQYQIKRCSAPCVNYITKEDYQSDIDNAVLFIEGKKEKIIKTLTEPMQIAADELDYEKAAKLRDQIRSVREIQEKQYAGGKVNDVDIVACAKNNNQACIQLSFIRSGLNLGSRKYYPRHLEEQSESDLIQAFLSQFYLNNKKLKKYPAEILVSHDIDEKALVETVIYEKFKQNIKIKYKVRGERAKWLSIAKENATLDLRQKLAINENLTKRYKALQDLLSFAEPIEKMECFDISHMQGESTVGSCVVFGKNGAIKEQYRKFNIENITKGDDYAATSQIIRRRYMRLIKENNILPDLILIDGGKGQINVAKKELDELQLSHILILGIAKGPSRKAGMENLILSIDNEIIECDSASPALHLIQHIRDEAHRFAIMAHRQKRKKKRSRSILEEIEGIGNKRRQLLIRHFGGLQGVSKASINELAKVSGINKNLAKKIYETIHDDP